MYKKYVKRQFDLIFAIFFLIILAPIFLVVSIWLYFANKGAGVFFFQDRPGENSKIFKVIKFKTMTDERDVYGNLLPDAHRITKLGQFIRSTSIDELPQLINIIKGEMSFIGPRPLMVKYLVLYTKDQARRHNVKPGLTGWAQVNGRNSVSWKQKFEYDIWYVDNYSFWIDLKIGFLTIRKILLREGVTKEGMSTTDTYNGNN